MIDLRSTAGLARSLAIYYGRPWRIAAMARFYSGFMGPGDLAFDVGAHVGNRSLAMAWTGARVIALEPQAMCQAFLRRAMPTSVTVLPPAAGPAEATGILAVSRRHPTVSSLVPAFPATVGQTSGFRGVVWDAVQAVEVTTLDALIEAYGSPAFVKIDVEGYEAEVLAGLGRAVPALAVEFLPEALDVVRLCMDRLQGLGDYTFNFIRGEGHQFVLPRWDNGSSVLGALEVAARDGRPGDLYARLRTLPRAGVSQHGVRCSPADSSTGGRSTE